MALNFNKISGLPPEKSYTMNAAVQGMAADLQVVDDLIAQQQDGLAFAKLNTMFPTAKDAQAALDKFQKSFPHVHEYWTKVNQAFHGATATAEVLKETLAVTQTEIVPKISTEPVTEVEAKVQEYLVMYRKLEEIGGKQLIARMEAVRKELQLIATEKFEQGDKAVLKCVDGEMEFSACPTQDHVTDAAKLIHHLFDKYGEQVAFSCVKISITELKKIMGELELQPFVESKPGPRTLKAVRLNVGKTSTGGKVMISKFD